MKKLLAAIFTVISIAAVCAFAGCGNDDRSRQKHNEIEQGYSISYAFTASNDVLTIGENTTVKDYLDALKADGKLSYEGYEGDYGYYINSVLGVQETYGTNSMYYWAVYTSVTEIDGTIYATDYSTFNYNGIKLYSASYGVSGLPCVEGETYALVYTYTTW